MGTVNKYTLKLVKRMESFKFFVKCECKVDWEHDFILDCDCQPKICQTYDF